MSVSSVSVPPDQPRRADDLGQADQVFRPTCLLALRRGRHHDGFWGAAPGLGPDVTPPGGSLARSRVLAARL